MNQPSPKEPRRKRGVSKDELLDAAARAFARDGFYATTMKEIAAELGLTPGALYSHCEGKEQLFADAHERLRKRLHEAVTGLMPTGLSFAQEVELMLLRVFELTEAHRAELAMFIDSRASEEIEGHRRERGFTVMRRQLELWFIEHTAALSCQPDLAACVFAGAICGLVRTRVTDDATPPLVPRAAEVRALLLGGVARVENER